MVSAIELLKKTVDTMTDEGWSNVIRELGSLVQHSDETEEALFFERLYDYVITIPGENNQKLSS